MAYRILLVFGLVATFAGAALPSCAQPASDTQVVFDAPPPKRDAAEDGLLALDRGIYDKVAQAKTNADFAKVERELKLIMSHVPTEFRLYEDYKGQLVVRADREIGMPIAAAMAKDLPKTDPPGPVKVSFEPNVYGFAALALSSLALERKDAEAALSVLNVGASIQPDNAKMVEARARALATLGRLPEALRAYAAWTRNYPVQAELNPADTALMWRGMGSVLVEQKQYDDAKESYESALKLVPGDPTTLAALQRVEQLRVSAPPTAN